ELTDELEVLSRALVPLARVTERAPEEPDGAELIAPRAGAARGETQPLGRGLGVALGQPREHGRGDLAVVDARLHLLGERARAGDLEHDAGIGTGREELPHEVADAMGGELGRNEAEERLERLDGGL